VSHRRTVLILVSVVAGLVDAVSAQRDFSKVEIKTHDLGNGVYMLSGAGGNLGLYVGPDGVFLVDDQYAPLTDKIRAAIAAVSDKPIRFVVNTHWHGDHTGGNENLARTGTLVLAHDNVRKRLAADQLAPGRDGKVPGPVPDALPVVTFSDTVTLHARGGRLVAAHFPHAHTDGDAVIWFRDADVVHMGDVFFNGTYPFIDVASGGSIDGLVAAVGTVLEQTGPETRIIPGHGPLAGRDALAAYHAMLTGVRDAVRRAAAGGKSLADVQAAKPTAEWDAEWGDGFIKPDRMVEAVYAGVAAR